MLLPASEWLSVAKGALMAVGAALVAYLGQALTATANDHTAGGLVFAAVLSVVINVARKMMPAAPDPVAAQAEPMKVVLAEPVEPQPPAAQGPKPQPVANPN
jgi:hypothetical protein